MKAEKWTAVYHDSENTIQGGLAGYSIQSNNGEGVAFNVCRKIYADLISAAPDLLLALEELIAEVEHDRKLNHHALETTGFDMARVAIRKATGHQADAIQHQAEQARQAIAELESVVNATGDYQHRVRLEELRANQAHKEREDQHTNMSRPSAPAPPTRPSTKSANHKEDQS